jgi:predicted O-methyltransferase YrrM
MNISGIGLVNLLKDKQQLIGLEIGCYAGVNASYLLKNLNIKKLHGVDPYIEYIDWNGGVTCQSGDPAEQQANERLKFYTNFIKHKKTSDDAVNQFKDEIFDFIFIDGLHTYEQVLMDCKNYYSKLKPGGIFSGHDYTAISDVNKAVNEFAKQVNKQICTMQTDSWYWIK